MQVKKRQKIQSKIENAAPSVTNHPHRVFWKQKSVWVFFPKIALGDDPKIFSENNFQ